MRIRAPRLTFMFTAKLGALTDIRWRCVLAIPLIFQFRHAGFRVGCYLPFAFTTMPTKVSYLLVLEPMHMVGNLKPMYKIPVLYSKGLLTPNFFLNP